MHDQFKLDCSVEENPLVYKATHWKVQKLREVPVYCKVIDTPERVAGFWRDTIPALEWFSEDQECFVVFHLNTRRRLTGFNLVSQGTLDTILVHPRDVFRAAIVAGAASIVLSHNHPSGDPTPSEGDVKVTRDLIRAGQLLKMEVLDHLVIGSNDHSGAFGKGYCSLRELGYFQM